MPRRSTAFRVALLVLAAMVLGGCASGGEVFQPALVAPDRAVIYIFRQSSRALRSTPVQVFINQESAGELRPGRYLPHIVEPGEYLVRVEAASSMVREVVVAAGDVAYLMVTMGRKSRPVIETPEPELARRLIAGTRKVGPAPGAASGSGPSSADQTAVH